MPGTAAFRVPMESWNQVDLAAAAVSPTLVPFVTRAQPVTLFAREARSYAGPDL
jgi:hypothetical protein